jgi:hypothetical protein
MNCISIQATGRTELRDIPEDLCVLQDAVGGYLESLLLRTDQGNAVMLLNEEGKLLNLPINVEASFLAVRFAGICDKTDWICGNVLLFGEADAEGNLTEAPMWLRNLLRL